jgi:homoserine dehydrogenase
MKNINIGLIGFGVVGEGIYNVLNQKPNIGAQIKHIVIKDANKKRNAPNALFSNDIQNITDDKDINLVVELIDDAEAAYSIIKKVINKGKSVISANKKMIAEHHLELIKLSQINNVSFLYEAAVCGSIPIIRNLEEYYDNDWLNSIQGIVNGSTNYILSKMLKNGESYAQALGIAQDKGFAESNPKLDVEGIDASYKLSIMALHAFGQQIDASKILRKGITALTSFDFKYALEKNKAIKLIAKANTNHDGKIDCLSVLPTFVPLNSTLGKTDNEYNGVLVGSSLADEQFLYGKGAGRYPTSSAVLSDISAFGYGYKYEYKKGLDNRKLKYTGNAKIYVGDKHDNTFNTDIFAHIDERLSDSKRSYIIGYINLNKLNNSDILNDTNISVIAI